MVHVTVRSLVVLWLVCVSLFAQPSEVVFGVFAYRTADKMALEYQPLVDHLARELGTNIRLSVLSQEALEEEVSHGRIDLVATNPTHFIALRSKGALTGAMATMVKRVNQTLTPYLGGVIVTRVDAPIDTLEDVRGKRIGFPGKKFLGGFQTQAFEFQEQGIDLLTQTKLKELSSHDQVLISVISGDIDVGLVRSGIIEELTREGKINPSDLKLLNARHYYEFPLQISTELYPEWAIAASVNLSQELVRKVAIALFTYTPQEGQKHDIIQGFSIPADYTVVDRLARTLRLPPYDAAPTFTLRDIWNAYRFAIIFALFGIAITVGLLLIIARTNRALSGTLARLKESEARLGFAFEASADGLWELEVASGTTHFSSVMAAMAGVKEAELTWQRLLMPEDLRILEAAFEACYSGDRDRFDVTVRTSSSTSRMRYLRLRGMVIRNNEKRVLRIIGTATDITAIETARHKALEAERFKSHFMANMSHEIRTPLNGIVGFVQLLARSKLDEKQMRYIVIIQSSINTLMGVVNDILDFSKIQEGKMQIECIALDPAAEFPKAFSIFEAKAKEKQLEYRVVIDPALLGCLMVDLLHVKQAVTNLIGNAIKFTDSGGSVEVAVRVVETLENGQKVEFGVKDSGMGIAPEKLESIFDTFTQADASITRKYGGTGLGLSIASALIEQMGGALKVESREGEGSRFYFELLLHSCTM